MLKARPKADILHNEEGNAMVETFPLLVIFMLLLSYSLGLYGVIHTATLNSISARNYAFATLRHRANYTYFRDNNFGNDITHTEKIQFRYHAISVDSPTDDNLHPVVRPIFVGRAPSDESQREINRSNQQVHTNAIYDITRRNSQLSITHAWVMVGYGICLNPRCGAEGP